MATAAVTWAAWVAWADIDSSVRFGGTENRTRLEEIPAAFLFWREFNKIDIDFNFIELYKTKEQFNFIK
jgi:hypothetical protein